MSEMMRSEAARCGKAGDISRMSRVEDGKVLSACCRTMMGACVNIAPTNLIGQKGLRVYFPTSFRVVRKALPDTLFHLLQHFKRSRRCMTQRA